MGVFVRMGSKTGEQAYTNSDAISKSIKYNTRTGGTKEGQTDLIVYGGVGVTNNDPEQMIQEMQEVQEVYGQQKGRRMYHYTYTINREEYGRLGCNDEAVELIVREMVNEAFYNKGYQVEYAIHKNGSGKEGCRHAHIVVNSVNYMTGRKYHENNEEYAYKQSQINQIQDRISARCPVRFTDMDKIGLE